MSNIPLYLSLMYLLTLSLTSSLTPDGTLLLSFKYSILSDPLSVLDNWAYSDPTPCSWTGITCEPVSLRVVSLVLSHSQLIGSIPEDLGFIERLRELDLSDNLLNGSLPGSLFNHTELQKLSLSTNGISGRMPEIPAGGVGLQVLNLSNNALAGSLPENLSNSKNLTVISLKNNHFSGPIPSLFNFVEILDLSSNSLNGSLPIDFGGERVTLLNLSNNNFSGSVSSKFASKIPKNSSIDISFNNLSGPIPIELSDRKTEDFDNNLDLCGKPLKKLCTIASSISIPPNITSSSPAIAAIPRSIGTSPDNNNDNNNSTGNAQINGQKRIKLGTILGITVGDLAGIAVLGVVFMYMYRLRRRKNRGEETGEVKREKGDGGVKEEDNIEKGYGGCGCIGANGGESTEEGVSSSNVSDTDENINNNGVGGGKMVVAEEEMGIEQRRKKKSLLVMVDGETKLELETLLKASAYILGSTGSSIVYKAVLQDGTSFAVRRIGEGRVERLKDFESKIRALAKLRHPNLVRIRGFYWGDDEKLIIHDYVSNGSLTCSTGYKRVGSSSAHFSFELRLKIARGLAKGLTYIHEKKQVHGNIKPSNILLTPEIDPVISDLGLDRLHAGGGARQQSAALDSSHMHDIQINSSQYPSGSSVLGSVSAYHAPESLHDTKPTPKWDVYSFGVIFLELLTGRVFSARELGQWAAGPLALDWGRVVKMADMAIRADIAGREDAMLACLELGFGCTSLVPQKRPSMKEVVQVLEKKQFSSSREN